ncbi:2OG-Fe(II) oxygenase family protein [Seonamhaeicola sp. MEBiC1930]|uniref:2OG-Fe(II) oxygenase family protein n=1 Tax=Seonamhaeicola sp. MEBiC01930 TaxID=2976768 RepID=UPI0032568F0E
MSLNAFHLLKTEEPKSSDVTLKKAFKSFLNKPNDYKKGYLQAQFNYAFDGYSFLGQKDSLNQYDTDLLNSFVLSKFSKTDKFPNEFHYFLNNEWDKLTEKIRRIERKIIKKLNLPHLTNFYEENIGHMVSCNYYPPVSSDAISELRLSKHIDVSLFTVFVFGISDGFAYQNLRNHKEVLGASDNIVIFPGYLLEYLTHGEYTALKHQVEFSNVNHERFSFAFFSIPKPFQEMEFNGKKFTSEKYYENYLNLF